MSPKTIGIIGFNGVTASHLTGPADAFAAAVLDDGFGGRIPCYKVWTIGLTSGPFTTDSGLLFQPGKTLADAPPLDTLVVPGGSGAREISEPLAKWILSSAYETRRITSICTGLHALAATGLLDGREVATHWRAARELQQRYPALRINHKRRLIKDGPFYTSAGLTAGVDLALGLIEEDYGQHVALVVRRDLMLYLDSPSQPNEKREEQIAGNQSIDRFADLVAWMMRNLHGNLTIETMARQAGMCPAHFTRVFKSVFGNTPGGFVENLRLNEARRRLSSRGKTLRSVAASVGFTNPDTFRRAFERRFGARPGTYLSDAKPLSANLPAGARR